LPIPPLIPAGFALAWAVDQRPGNVNFAPGSRLALHYDHAEVFSMNVACQGGNLVPRNFAPGVKSSWRFHLKACTGM
jgi:hypothetical protein